MGKTNMFVMKLIVICLYIQEKDLAFYSLNGGLSVVATHPEVVEADVRYSIYSDSFQWLTDNNAQDS